MEQDGIVLRLPRPRRRAGAVVASASKLVLIEPEELQQAGGWPSSAPRPCSGLAFREAAARALPDPPRVAGPTRAPLWAAAPEGAEPAGGRARARRLPDRAPRAACATYSTSPACRRSCATCTVARSRSSRSMMTSAFLFAAVRLPRHLYEGDAPSAQGVAPPCARRRRVAAARGAARIDRPRGARSACARSAMPLSSGPGHRARRAARALRHFGDLSAAESANACWVRSTPRSCWRGWCANGARSRCVCTASGATWPPTTRGSRDALGAVRGGLPEAFLADVPDALRRSSARYAGTHGPFTTARLRWRYRH